MSLLKVILLGLFVVATACNAKYRSLTQFSNSKDAQVWKIDRCGIGNYRYKIHMEILKNKRIFIGVDSDTLKSIIGDPEFVNTSSIFEYPNALFYEYSLSSVEIMNGKCGDPITKSLSFAIDTNTNKVIGIQVFIY